MDYLATYPNAYIRYYASDMILNIDSDAAYLVAPPMPGDDDHGGSRLCVATKGIRYVG